MDQWLCSSFHQWIRRRIQCRKNLFMNSYELKAENKKKCILWYGYESIWICFAFVVGLGPCSGMESVSVNFLAAHSHQSSAIVPARYIYIHNIAIPSTKRKLCGLSHLFVSASVGASWFMVGRCFADFGTCHIQLTSHSWTRVNTTGFVVVCKSKYLSWHIKTDRKLHVRQILFSLSLSRFGRNFILCCFLYAYGTHGTEPYLLLQSTRLIFMQMNRLADFLQPERRF